MDETKTKPIRRFLHLGKSVAAQVREQAARWGLGEMEAIHQLIRLGLRASSEEAKAGANDLDVNQVGRLVTEILSLQLEALLYQRETAADAALTYERVTAVGVAPPGKTAVAADASRAASHEDAAEARRGEQQKKLDAKVRELARSAFKRIYSRAVDPNASRSST